jgi:hypothetical protein
MDKKRLTYKEILLMIGYLVIIIAYEFDEHLSLIPMNSFLRVFFGFFGIISISLVYLLIVQKERFRKIILNIKIYFPYLAIPAFISFLIIIALPFFVSLNSYLFNLIILLVVIGSGILSLVIIRTLSKNVPDKKNDRG